MLLHEKWGKRQETLKGEERRLAPSSHPSALRQLSFRLSHNAPPTGSNTGVRPISLATRVLIVTFHYSQWQRGDSNDHLEEVRQGPMLRHQSKRGTQTEKWLWKIIHLKIIFWVFEPLHIFLMVEDTMGLGSWSAFPLINQHNHNPLQRLRQCREAQMRSEQSPAWFYWNQIPL